MLALEATYIDLIKITFQFSQSPSYVVNMNFVLFQEDNFEIRRITDDESLFKTIRSKCIVDINNRILRCFK